MSASAIACGFQSGCPTQIVFIFLGVCMVFCGIRKPALVCLSTAFNFVRTDIGATYTNASNCEPGNNWMMYLTRAIIVLHIAGWNV